MRIEYNKWDLVHSHSSEDEGRPQAMTNNAPKRAKSTEAQLQSDQIVPTREVSNASLHTVDVTKISVARVNVLISLRQPLRS